MDVTSPRTVKKIYPELSKTTDRNYEGEIQSIIQTGLEAELLKNINDRRYVDVDTLSFEFPCEFESIPDHLIKKYNIQNNNQYATSILISAESDLLRVFLKENEEVIIEYVTGQIKNGCLVVTPPFWSIKLVDFYKPIFHEKGLAVEEDGCIYLYAQHRAESNCCAIQ